MNINDIKSLADKTPVADVRGIVEKQYPPAEQTPNDQKWSQHRQSLLVKDDEGNKLMVTLMKEPLHILDSVEGSDLRLTAGTNQKGETRGLVLNRWAPAGATSDKFTLKVYPEATIRILPPGGSVVADPPKAVEVSNGANDSSAAVAPDGETAFHKQLELSSYAFSICLDKAEEILVDRKHAQSPENYRVVATNLFLDAKAHMRSLTVPKAPAGGAMEDYDPKTGHREDLAERLIKGHKMREDGELGETALAVLETLTKEATEFGGVWEEAYDALAFGVVHSNQGDSTAENRATACNLVFDAIQKTQPSPEMFVVMGQEWWREQVQEEIGRIAGV